jgi:hypothetical protein
MAGYGIQNAVSSVVDNSVKIKKLVDLLPSEEDRAVKVASDKEEAARLRTELAEQDAADAQKNAQKAQEFSDGLAKRSAARKRAVIRSVNKGKTDPHVGELIKENEDRMSGNARLNAEESAKSAARLSKRAQEKADQAQQAHRATIEAKIKALEVAGQRKKTVFERLRGGSK